MSDSKSKGAGGGVGISTIIFIVNLILKLTGAVDMPWWSWNPVEWSVFITVTWGLYIIAVVWLCVFIVEVFKRVGSK